MKSGIARHVKVPNLGIDSWVVVPEGTPEDVLPRFTFTIWRNNLYYKLVNGMKVFGIPHGEFFELHRIDNNT